MGIETYCEEYVDRLRQMLVEILPDQVARAAGMLQEARGRGSRIYIFGNGGSAVTASHFAVDLAKGTASPGEPRFRAISLSENIAVLTAVGNDYSYEEIFEEQLRGLVEPGDMAIGISASGNSPNVLRAIEYAKSQGASTLGLVGFGGGKLAGLADLALVVSPRNYGLSEEAHLILIHILTQYLKNELAGKPNERVPV
jgi:D-sedoheptulose 7-phosphate isomerase